MTCMFPKPLGADVSAVTHTHLENSELRACIRSYGMRILFLFLFLLLNLNGNLFIRMEARLHSNASCNDLYIDIHFANASPFAGHFNFCNGIVYRKDGRGLEGVIGTHIVFLDLHTKTLLRGVDGGRKAWI